jgi:predicted DNA-binding protein with PD1-like motif
MRHKQVAVQPKLSFSSSATGDEIIGELCRLAAEQRLAGSSFTAIGALSRVKLS